jgi:hypothetical protein
MMEGVNLRYIASTFVKVTMYPLYNNMIIKIKLNFLKRQDSKYFRVCGPYSLDHRYSTMSL